MPLHSALLRSFVVALLGILVAGGCRFQGIALRQDQRVKLVSPDFREQVTLPVTIDWTVEDFEVTGPGGQPSDDSGYFGVFIDTDPQPPGEGLEYFSRDDVECRNSKRCLTRDYLAQRGVYTTSDTEITIEQIAPAPGVNVERGERDLHEVTIVLLDAQGRRIGEGSWSTTFELVGER